MRRQRLFATAALMAQLPLDAMDEDASEGTLFGFVDSAIALGQQPLALGMLRWIVEGLELVYLPLAILIIDRSQKRPLLSSSSVKALVARARTLDQPDAALFYSKHAGMRAKQWRVLLRDAIEREVGRRASRALDADALAVWIGWMELALQAGKR